MPNWVSTSWNVTLPTDKVTRFLSYFLTSDDRDKSRERFLYRTFIDEVSISTVDSSGITTLNFFSDSAWSLLSILRDYDKEGKVICPSLDWVCKDCEVIFLEAKGDEPGMGFREYIEWDSNDGLSFDSYDVTPWCCAECHTMGYWEDEDPDVDTTICPSCGHKLEEELE
jgi:hypothetical protein